MRVKRWSVQKSKLTKEINNVINHHEVGQDNVMSGGPYLATVLGCSSRRTQGSYGACVFWEEGFPKIVNFSNTNIGNAHFAVICLLHVRLGLPSSRMFSVPERWILWFSLINSYNRGIDTR
jgi:hypothetical protein